MVTVKSFVGFSSGNDAHQDMINATLAATGAMQAWIDAQTGYVKITSISAQSILSTTSPDGEFALHTITASFEVK